MNVNKIITPIANNVKGEKTKFNVAQKICYFIFFATFLGNKCQYQQKSCIHWIKLHKISFRFHIFICNSRIWHEARTHSHTASFKKNPIILIVFCASFIHKHDLFSRSLYPKQKKMYIKLSRWTANDYCHANPLLNSISICTKKWEKNW